MNPNRTTLLLNQARKKILLFDGAIGTELLNLHLNEDEFRSGRFQQHPKSLLDNIDILTLTQPDRVAQLHRSYLEAGADIISTNSFMASYATQEKFGTQDLIYEINFRAAQLARTEADRISELTVSNPRFVAGIVGPLDRWNARNHISLSDQIDGLIDGGADLILAESLCFGDSTRPMLAVVSMFLEERDEPLPLWVSFAVTRNFDSDALLQEIDFMVQSDLPIKPLIVGLNCGSADDIPEDILSELGARADILISCHPSAGLPDITDGYPISEERFKSSLMDISRKGLLNVVGGCCGTTPAYIEKLAPTMAGLKPRSLGF